MHSKQRRSLSAPFNLACSLPCLNHAAKCIISAVLGLCLVPESPRWLVSVGQSERALAVIRNAAAVNGVNPDTAFRGIKLEEEHVEESGICSLFSRKWRKISFLLALTWAGFAISYYGSVLAITRIFEGDAVEGAGVEASSDTPNFDYKAIFISASVSGSDVFLSLSTDMISFLGFFWRSLTLSVSCV